MRANYAFAWRDRVEDPNWLVICLCGHAEQIHGEHRGACTAGPIGWRCMCDKFAEKKRQWVGAGEAPT